MSVIFSQALMGFLSSEAQVKEAVTWVEGGNFKRKDGRNIEGAKLTANDRQTAIKAFVELPGESREKKEQLVRDELERDKSEKGKLFELTCYALLPDAERKAEVWERALDREGKLSFYEHKALMEGFWSVKQGALLQNYFNKFVEAIPDIANRGDKDFVKNFLFGMCPAYGVDDEYIERLKKAGSEFSDVKYDSFQRALNDLVVAKQRSKPIRDFSKSA